MDDLFSSKVDLPVKELEGFDLVLEQMLSQPQYQSWVQMVNTAGALTLSLLREVLSEATDFEYLHYSITEALVGASIDTSFSNAEELVKLPLKKRITDQDTFSAFITLSGETKIINKKLERILSIITERDLAFFKYFIAELDKRGITLNGMDENFDLLLDLSRLDALPEGLSQENLPLLLQVYPPRRKETSFYKIFSYYGEEQAGLLKQQISEGSRGLTKENADISRDVMGHIGKVLQNLIYTQLWEGNITEIPKELQPFVSANNEVDKSSNMWDKFEGGKATDYFKKLFDNDESCEYAYRYTSEIIAWWIISKLLKPTLRNYGVDYNLEYINGIELQKWLVKYAQIDLSGIITGFTQSTISDLIYELEYFLEGFKHDHRSFPDERETLVDNIPQTKHLLPNAVLEIVSGWLRTEHSGLTRSVTSSLMGLTRVINADFINTLRRGTYFTEFAVPSDHDTNQRCDIVILPEEIDIEYPTWNDFNSADLLEIKLVQTLSVTPSKKFLAQIEKYIRNIRKVNPNIKIKPLLLEVSGMGIKLTEVSKYLEEI
ncbi:MAG: hypothetical protein ACMG57_01405 [Candidatus Dojkabacteria bacterium]